jgi:hypothetical protein
VIDVQGRCPACRWSSLFLGDGGHVTCSRLECPNPSLADDLLHAESEPALLAAIGRVRKLGAELFVDGATRTHRAIGRQILNALQPPEDGEPTDGCTTACDGVTGIRGLLEHVGVDTTGRDITVGGRTVDAAPAHNDGPSIAECAQADRRWPLEKHGE